MTGRALRRLGTLAVAVAAALPLLAVPGSASPGSPNHGTSAVRNATDRYHDVAVAEAAGYGAFADAAGILCIDKPGVGAMGIHYVAPWVADDKVELTRPEAVIYAPQADGSLRLVAVEYIVFADAWDAHHAKAPTLAGAGFSYVAAGNRYGIPAFYELHSWVWQDNPLGLHNDWNPTVSC